jgi:arylformamidase
MSVYLQYDQEQLDQQYNNRQRVADFDALVADWQNRSLAFSQRTEIVAEIAYGRHSREYLDIIPASDSQSPVQVFFHGGYWQALDKAVFHFVAEGFFRNGITTVMVNYPLAPAARIDTIVASCRRALAWIHTNIGQYNGDHRRLYLSGHSAGGHLVAMLMATAWDDVDRPLPESAIKGGCSISGLFDLEPIRLCYLNKVLAMDRNLARRNSPLTLAPAVKAPLILSVGALESEEYHRQSLTMGEVWQREGIAIARVPVAQADHFSILDSLVETNGILLGAILKQMNIN